MKNCPAVGDSHFTGLTWGSSGFYWLLWFLVSALQKALSLAYTWSLQSNRRNSRKNNETEIYIISPSICNWKYFRGQFCRRIWATGLLPKEEIKEVLPSFVGKPGQTPKFGAETHLLIIDPEHPLVRTSVQTCPWEAHDLTGKADMQNRVKFIGLWGLWLEQS